jgi:hypothetical protein
LSSLLKLPIVNHGLPHSIMYHTWSMLIIIDHIHFITVNNAGWQTHVSWVCCWFSPIQSWMRTTSLSSVLPS